VDSGHYVSWVKRAVGSESAGAPVPAGEAKWLKFDDDKVSEVKEDDIKSLHGGGDFDMSYLVRHTRVHTCTGSGLVALAVWWLIVVFVV